MKQWSLKRRITLYFFCLSIIPSVILFLMYSELYANNTREYENTESVNTLSFVEKNIENRLTLASELTNWYAINQKLEKVLTMPYDGSPQKKVEILSFVKDADIYNMAHSVGPYIAKILIVGNNGVSIQIGSGDRLLKEDRLLQLEQQDQFISSFSGNTYYWKNVDYYWEGEYFILARELRGSVSGEKIGDIFCAFEPSLIESLLPQGPDEFDQRIIVLNADRKCVATSEPAACREDIARPYFSEIDFDKSQSFEAKVEDNSVLINTYPCERYNWMLVKESSSAFYRQVQKEILSTTCKILGLACMGCLILSVIISRHLNFPIERLVNRIQCIAQGDFSYDESIVGENELGRIGKGINFMTLRIQNLLDHKLRIEREKNEIEFQMMQNQINPHFLYNTLNCIKMMAELQSSYAIRDMLQALSDLMQESAHAERAEIPLFQEFSIVDQYIHILNIRNGGMIRLEYSLPKEDVLDCLILKFTLQPIVENAVFHGIMPNCGIGTIKISVSSDQDVLCIQVCDDGVGMDKETLKNVLEAHPKGRRSMNSIGIQNVHRRIQLQYGENYGIQVQSELGKGTQVSVYIPVKRRGKDDTGIDC